MEWNAVTGPGSQVFRVLRDCPRKHRDCQLGQFIPAKTRLRVCVVMRDVAVLMRDVEAKYHGGTTSRN